MVFRWWPGDGPLLVVIGPSLPLSIKKNRKKMARIVGLLPLTKVSGSVHV